MDVLIECVPCWFQASPVGQLFQAFSVRQLFLIAKKAAKSEMEILARAVAHCKQSVLTTHVPLFF